MKQRRNFHSKQIFGIASILSVLILVLWVTPLHSSVQADSCTHYVNGSSGNDANNGSLAAPWRTIQKAADTAAAGNVVCVRAGTYAETVVINNSGSAGGGYITFQNYPSETAILDGSSLTVPEGWAPMIQIIDSEYVIVKGFEIRNYRSNLINRVPVGIMVNGTGGHIELRDNIIHDIETNYGGMNGGDAHGLAVYGTSGTQPFTNIVIDNNQLYDLKLGSSEGLVVNGNMDGFEITNNTVHDVNNIGIVAIGFEDTASSNDQARNGLIKGNTVYNITSFGNPAYGPARSAGCIYVDGGAQIVIENNTAHNCDLGVELASEHKNKFTSNITLRNNLIYNNHQAGISIGGYDTQRGGTENSVIVNNTLYNNTTQGDWGAELYVQYNAQDNIVQNNIFFNSAGNFIESWSAIMSGNSVNYNLYFSNGVVSELWTWANTSYNSFPEYQAGSGNDSNSLHSENPLFVNVNTNDFELQVNSPAINAGNNATCADKDYLGTVRPLGGACDIGFFETNQYSISGNAGVAHANLSYSDGSAKMVQADESGTYVLGVSPNWTGTVTPSKTGYIFSPVSLDYINVNSDFIAQNYTAIAPPTSITLSNFSVHENQKAGTVIGLLGVRDLEENDSHVFNLQTGVTGCASTDNAVFTISGLQLKTKAILDYEAGKTRSICIRVTDSNGLTLDRPFTISILNVKDEAAPQTGARISIKRTSGNSTSYVFMLTSSEANSSFVCRLDSGAYTTCSATKAYSKLTQGTHVFYAYAVDSSGNADPTPVSITFFVR